jgi:predicted nucleic acid-binding protein
VSVVYDAGVLVAADRNDREVWADHRLRLEVGMVPATTAPVVAQVSRSPRQAQLRRFLRGCSVVPFLADDAHSAGSLLGGSGMSDVVDAHVVLTAASASATVLTSDPDDLRRLSEQLQAPLAIRRV